MSANGTQGYTALGYARHRGVQVYAVQEAIRNGRISTLPDGRIDPLTADQEWARYTHPLNGAASSPDRLPPGVAVGASYQEARSLKEIYAAQLARLEYEERAGELLKKRDVDAAISGVFQRLRDQLLQLSNRLSAILAAESDEARVYEILDAEIRRALNDIADHIKPA